MLTSPTMCGRRCGASRRSTRVCRRSASLMITCVYSRKAFRWASGSSSSSSWAAPRMPPSGFLISCARLRISSLLAWLWSSRRSSRSSFSCCTFSRNSTTTSASPAALTMLCTCSGSRAGRCRVRSWRRSAYLWAAACSHSEPSSSPLVNRLASFWRDSDLTEISSRCSAAGLAWRTRPPASTTSTADASISRPAKRSSNGGWGGMAFMRRGQRIFQRISQRVLAISRRIASMFFSARPMSSRMAATRSWYFA